MFRVFVVTVVFFVGSILVFGFVFLSCFYCRRYTVDVFGFIGGFGAGWGWVVGVVDICCVSFGNFVGW